MYRAGKTILTAHPIVNASRLTWVASASLLVAEASDLGPMTPVYEGWHDLGFTLQSRYPNVEPVVMVIDHEAKDRDNDIVYWDLVPADGIARGFGVRIYND